jgi:hypothetical protein
VFVPAHSAAPPCRDGTLSPQPGTSAGRKAIIQHSAPSVPPAGRKSGASQLPTADSNQCTAELIKLDADAIAPTTSIELFPTGE